MKGLEAIKIIDDTFRYGHTDDEGYEVPPYKMCDVCDEQFETIKKELKAFDIIVAKNVDMYRLAVADNVASYNKWTEFDEYWLTEEEFDLIKEVLKND